MFVELPEMLTIRGTRCIIRPAYELMEKRKNKSELQINNEENLRNNSPSGIMNRKIRLQMKKIIVNWIEVLKKSPILSNGHREYYPTFVTLTLPSEQIHSDKDLHVKALNRFITTLRRTHEIKNYVWRAERQENGNLHYHIITDKFISHSLIRQYWNTIMNDLGYINAYRVNQQMFHNNGFKYRQTTNEKWTYEKQYNAYVQGVSENWSNPNSTDIHSLKNIEDISSYVCKYTTKSDEFDTMEQLKKSYQNNDIDESFYNTQVEILNKKIEAIKINGRVWGCSDEIKNLKDPSLVIGTNEIKFIDEIISDESSKVITDEHFTIVYSKKIQQKIKEHKTIKEHIDNHYQKAYDIIYCGFVEQLLRDISHLTYVASSKPPEAVKQLFLFA